MKRFIILASTVGLLSGCFAFASTEIACGENEKEINKRIRELESQGNVVNAGDPSVSTSISQVVTSMGSRYDSSTEKVCVTLRYGKPSENQKNQERIDI